MKRLAGRRALVTGSTQGLGAAIARRFAAEGARVVVTGRDVKRGEAMARRLGRACAGFIRADLSDPELAKAVGAEAVRRLGGLDILVNSAALPERSDLGTFTVPHFEYLFRLNVLAPLLLAQVARPALAKRRGVVINIGSVNAYGGHPTLLVYSATKGALMTATRNLADALADERIRFHCLNVGWMDSDGERQMMAALGKPATFLDEAGRASPIGRLISPEDVAEVALALADPRTAAFSGCVVDLEQFPVGAFGRRRAGPKGP